MVPFSVGADVSKTSSLPADPRLGTPEMDHEAALISEVRQALRLFDRGKITEAAAIWDRIAEGGEPLLEPYRIAWARARARWTLGKLDEADSLLAGLDTDAAPFDVRAHALVARALIVDRLGRRDDALRLYGQALAYLDSHPEFDDQLTVRPLRARIPAGLQAPQTKGPMPPTPALQRVPE